MNFRGHVQNYFFCILLCMDGVNVEISVDPMISEGFIHLSC